MPLIIVDNNNADKDPVFVAEFRKIHAWYSSDLKLERPSGSSVHHLREAFLGDKVYLISQTPDHAALPYAGAVEEASDACFVVQHDWAQAFHQARDFVSGEIRLPYDVCLFDFKVSGRRIVVLAITMLDSDVMLQFAICGDRCWLFPLDSWFYSDGRWSFPETQRSKFDMGPLVRLLGDQIKAVSVALDAEVAEKETVRASEKLIHSREKAGRTPPKPYHIVKLAGSKSGAMPLPREDNFTDSDGVRLHFRRGHWRHFDEHKTWVRWTLVGNPDLGFVEKEYRL